MAYELVDFPQSEENLGAGITRNVARQASNVSTRAIGLPGDIFSLINEYIARPVSKLAGQEDLPYEQTALGKVLPTTEFHRKGVESVTGEYLKPQNDVEKFVDDVVEDTALLFTPGGKLAKSGKLLKGSRQVPKNFYASLGANLAGEGVSQATGREDLGSLAKIGSLGFLSLIDKPSAVKQVGELYGKAEKAIPPGAMANAKKMEVNLDHLKNKVLSGRPSSSLAPSEKFVVDEIDKVLPMIKSGEIDVNTAWALKRSLNENLAKSVFDIPYKNRKRAKALATQINGQLRDTLDQYGKKNREFGVSFKGADEAFGTIARSEFIKNWIGENVRGTPLTHGLMHLLGSSAVTSIPGAIGKITGSTALGIAGSSVIPVAYQATKLGYQIAKSPTLRKIYADIIKAAAKEDVVSFNKYLKKLDKSLQEEESKSRYEFVDQ